MTEPGPQARTRKPNDVDVLIVGAGVIGLAVANALAERGRSVIVVESADRIGSATSSRNSEVIHSGLYYPTGSLKAKFCLAGSKAMYAFCETHGVPYQRCGKLVVAADEAEDELVENLHDRGVANGVSGLRLLSAREACEMEPALHCSRALWVPSAGIVDSHAFMLALWGDAERHGGSLAFRCPFASARPLSGGFVVSIGGVEPTQITATTLVNAAGLQASQVAKMIEGLDAAHIPETRYAKGNYFALNGKAPFARLIYPVPQVGGLGVHLTFDLAGSTRFGPDVEWVDAIDYDVDAARCSAFEHEIRKYWPSLPSGRLVTAYAGIRPKLGSGRSAADFRIDGPARHGVAGLINLFGIESPGLTASLAIAAHVASLC